MSLQLALAERAHVQHVEQRVLVPHCPLCDEIVAKRPDWVRRLALNARVWPVPA